jgi:hypothetical protein
VAEVDISVHEGELINSGRAAAEAVVRCAGELIGVGVEEHELPGTGSHRSVLQRWLCGEGRKEAVDLFAIKAGVRGLGLQGCRERLVHEP